MDSRKKSVVSGLKPLNEKQLLSRFADYFVICGLDNENGLEVENTGENNFLYLFQIFY